jgi:Disulphide bond corrector protein DsbC
MVSMTVRATIAAGLALALGALVASGQVDSASRLALNGSAVQYLFPEQITISAGKASNVILHFRVMQGLHINSHTPRDEYLIPTTFSIPDGLGVRLEEASYPSGADFTLPADPATKLSVYTDEFEIKARIVAEAGNHQVEAKLHFQACDKSVCYPPKTIPVAIDVVAK